MEDAECNSITFLILGNPPATAVLHGSAKTTVLPGVPPLIIRPDEKVQLEVLVNFTPLGEISIQIKSAAFDLALLVSQVTLQLANVHV